MNRIVLSVLIALSALAWHGPLRAQENTDSLTDAIKTKIFNNFKHFSFGFYADAYLIMELDHKNDTAKIIPFSANCPMTNLIRLNVAAFEIYYNAERVRGKFQLQFGDAPNLLAAPEKQWVKNIRQAAFGFRVAKDLWIDAGYMFTPIGCESAWPVINTISTVTMCGYFEPGALLGIKVSYKFSDKVDGGFMVGNPYSIAYQQTNHLAGLFFINYAPLKNLTLSYNSIFGNQALRNAELNNNLLYNDVIVAYNPHKNINLVGQFDFAFQTNSKLAPDTSRIASMCSGFLQAKFTFLKNFSVAGRYEYYYDPDGFLSGTYNYDSKTTGLTISGMTVSLEYKPVKIGYVRMEYKIMQANQGNKIYYNKTSDHMQAIAFTTGVRF